MHNMYNQIKINKNANDCKLDAENLRKIEISIWCLCFLGSYHYSQL